LFPETLLNALAVVFANTRVQCIMKKPLIQRNLEYALCV